MTEGRTIPLEYRRPGKPAAVYSERLLLDRPDVKVLSMEFQGSQEMRIEGATVLQPGSTITWFVFPGQWHDVGRFQLADGTFTGWYTNICTPVAADGDRWSITDLFLDLWLPADGSSRWLDEAEFDEAARTGVLDTDLARSAVAERARISASLARGAWPPDVCRTWGSAIFR